MKLPGNYIDYLDLVSREDEKGSSRSTSSKLLLEQNLAKITGNLAGIMPASYILDLTLRKYIHVDKHMKDITGYPSGYLLDGGTSFGLTLWNPQDLSIFSTKIFTDNIRVLKKVPPENHNQLVFECNYRITTKRGECKNILQRSMYISDPVTSMPVMSMGALIDISRIRNDGQIVHTITSSNGKAASKILHHATYFSRLHSTELSKRELEVLKWICEGLDSRSIAGKMFISLNTVNNHRTSIIAKTGCKNPLDLFKYALKRGLL